MQSPITRYLESVLDDCRELDGGAIAEGNAELERADPNAFAVALATVGGSIYSAGDCDVEFSIQSISKALAYAVALDDNGLERMLEATDVEPSGDSFNEISLEHSTGRPRNPLINAGALAVHSMIRGNCAQERADRVRDLHSRCAGRQLSTNTAVYEAEIESDDRNTAIAHLLKSVGVLAADPAEVVDGYARQCSVDVNCVDLATIASVMANGGVDPTTEERLIDGAVNRHVLSVMSTCGMYDGSGSWVATVGIPAKSGVAGAIIGVLPGQVGLAVLSPKLNEHGNSVRGVAVFERLSRDLELHMMHVAPSGSSAIRGVTGEDATNVQLQGDLRFAGAESVLAMLATGIDPRRRITLDLGHVRSMDDVARRLLDDAVAGLREDGHDVDIDDPHGSMTVPDPE
ncbi:putative glutaminase [Rhodococcus sp. AW25M09]|uniref:glutaminase A n=1 Tax=Rhodococcus sp. AW25M09 TaxID=1268303 RepID=UPI0002AC2F0A|nr:glutaminase A [Rhodococcus sp. AW25M09]CCQ17424.1 putative glutaminase [Rhodococcus sp. AW25M09]